MLQIASGRLFREKPGQRNELRGVLYTNLRMYNQVIDTAAGRLLYTSTLHDSKSLVYEFTELIEDDPAAGGILSHGIDPYLSDFAAVVSFALNVTCTPDPDVASRLLSGRPGPSVQFHPDKLIPQVFKDMIFCQPEHEMQLFEMVGQLISLERRSFLAAMRAIRSYVTGLHRLADDYELAYTLLVVSIESLAQEFDDFQPQWRDYDQRKRVPIDGVLARVDDVPAARIREVLLETEHVALGRRFREFALGHLRPSYFREEAIGLPKPAGRADLEDALRQAYNLRSGYIHELAELPSILKLPVPGETASLPFGPEVLLTFQGLARLARHVITTFIQKQTKVDREEYDYSRERVGILQAQLAPQYWIGDVAGLDVDSGRDRLEGFLKQASACVLQEPEAVITDLRKVLTHVERMLPQMNTEQRRPFIALYVLFNQLALPPDTMDNYDRIVERYGPELEDPSLESMLTFLLLGTVPNWTLARHRGIHDDYFRRKSRKNGLKVLPTLEAGLCLTLAERYRQAGDMVQARLLISAAVENHPGHVPLLELEQDFDPAQEINWPNTVRTTRADEDGGDPVAGTGAHDAQTATSKIFGRPSTLPDGTSS